MNIKTVITTSLICLLLTSCWNTPQPKQTNQIQTIKTEYHQQLNQSYKEIEKTAKKNLTWEKLKKVLEYQKKVIQELKNLTWEALNKQLLTKFVIPKLQELPENPKPCKSKSLSFYVKCLSTENVDIQKFANQIPDSQLKQTFLKQYYYFDYLNHKDKLFKKATNPIQLQAKKKAIQTLKYQGIIYNKKYCTYIPEKELQTYCKNLFKQK